MGIVLVGTSRTHVKVKVRQDWRSMTASSRAGQLSSRVGRRTSCEGCVTESLQTLTANLFGSADNDSAVSGQHAWMWWKCLSVFRGNIVSRKSLVSE